MSEAGLQVKPPAQIGSAETFWKGLRLFCGTGPISGLTIAPERAHIGVSPLRPVVRTCPAQPSPDIQCVTRLKRRALYVPPTRPRKDSPMAKGQKKTNKEIRKPKAEKPKTNASNPTLKNDSMLGIEKKKR